MANWLNWYFGQFIIQELDLVNCSERIESKFKTQIPIHRNHQGTCICYFRLSTHFIHRRSLLTCATTYYGYSISRGRDNDFIFIHIFGILSCGLAWPQFWSPVHKIILQKILQALFLSIHTQIKPHPKKLFDYLHQKVKSCILFVLLLKLLVLLNKSRRKSQKQLL